MALVSPSLVLAGHGEKVQQLLLFLHPWGIAIRTGKAHLNAPGYSGQVSDKPPPKFTVIQGTPPPDTPAERVRKRVRAMPKPPYVAQCCRCGGREMMETKIGVMIKNGKPTGGTKQLLCAHCHRKGERVVVKS